MLTFFSPPSTDFFLWLSDYLFSNYMFSFFLFCIYLSLFCSIFSYFRAEIMYQYLPPNTLMLFSWYLERFFPFSFFLWGGRLGASEIHEFSFEGRLCWCLKVELKRLWKNFFLINRRKYFLQRVTDEISWGA